jgi:hypothetical protein
VGSPYSSCARYAPFFLAGGAREDRRKFRNDVLPELRVPMIRMLNRSLATPMVNRWIMHHHSLEWGRVFSPPDPSWAVDCTYGTTGITISATVRHTLGPCIGINVLSTASSGASWKGWWYENSVSVARRMTATCLSEMRGARVGMSGVTAEAADRCWRCTVVKIRKTRRRLRHRSLLT